MPPRRDCDIISMDPSKKKSHKQIKKAMAAKQKHGLEDDERFAHAATDPTFRGGRKKRKLKIDPRFKGALDDERFGLAQGKVDKRGRKVDKNAQAESLAPFYELDDGLTAPERARRTEENRFDRKLHEAWRLRFEKTYTGYSGAREPPEARSRALTQPMALHDRHGAAAGTVLFDAHRGDDEDDERENEKHDRRRATNVEKSATTGEHVE